LVDVVSIGAINWDITLAVKDLASKGEEVEVLKIWRTPGGTGANVAVAAARILGKNQAALIGALGRDNIAREQIRGLKKEWVDVSGLKRVEGESGQAYIVVNGEGNNIIHTFLAANRKLSAKDLKAKKRRRLISEAKVVVITDPPLETVEEAISIASKAGGVIIWDPGVFVSLGLESLRPLAERVNYFVLSSPEAVSLFGEINPQMIAERLSCPVIVKQGSEGVLLVDRYKISYLVSTVQLGALGLRVVNSAGCGDAFLGAFASFKALGYADQESLKRANCAGAFNATRLETRGGPTGAQLDDLYKRAGRSLKVTLLS